MKSKSLVAILLISLVFLGYVSGMYWLHIQGFNHFAGIRIEFILFGLTLAGVAVFHKHTMYVALTGLLLILTSQWILYPEFSVWEHIAGGHGQEGEWKILLNLFGLLTGFTILASHFEHSGVPAKIPGIIPSGWFGGLTLLFLIMILSSFLDNIAAAMLGGTMAMALYKGRIHIGYLAAIVAASNAGGAWSVIGDTTTTLIWIQGYSPSVVFPAYIGTLGSFIIFGTAGAWIQEMHIRKQAAITSENSYGNEIQKEKLIHGNLIVVAVIIIATILTNYYLEFPALGVWVAILLGSIFIKTPWEVLTKSLKGTVFLVSLVLSASLMPVSELPEASWQTTFYLGALSAVFDNIPLTKLALEQGGFDWALLAYAVGFGGSMIWFGSSAGVALSNLFPQMKSVASYIKHSWFVMVAYIAGFLAILLLHGWKP